MKAADPTTGFRGFRPEVLRSIDLDTIRSNGYSFLVEVLYQAHRCGFRIGEEPIVVVERREGVSKMSKKIMMEAAMMPWRLRLSRFRPAAAKDRSAGQDRGGITGGGIGMSSEKKAQIASEPSDSKRDEISYRTKLYAVLLQGHATRSREK